MYNNPKDNFLSFQNEDLIYVIHIVWIMETMLNVYGITGGCIFLIPFMRLYLLSFVYNKYFPVSTYTT